MSIDVSGGKRPKFLETLAKRKTLLAFLCFGISIFSSCLNPKQQETFLLIEQQTNNLFKIYRVRPNGTEIQKLIEFQRGNNEYWLSPNGRQLAILTLWQEDKITGYPPQTLTIIDLLSSDVIGQVPDAGYVYPNLPRYYRVNKDAVVWSPLGDKLIFERNGTNEANTDLWLYDLTSNSVTPLTQSESDDLHPSWSPDGTHIAFASWQNCGQRLEDCASEEQFWNIKVVDVEGKNLRSVTDFRNTDFFILEDHFSTKTLCNLTWSPNGKHIAFENSCLPGYATYWHNVFLIDAEGNEIERVTDFALDQRVSHAETLPEKVFILHYSLEWSQTGDELYISYTEADYLDTEFSSVGGFVVVNVETGSIQHSSELSGLHWERNWSPTVTQFIVFTSRLNNQYMESGPTLLGRIGKDGQIVLDDISNNIPYGSRNEPIVHWSPEGKYIAYLTAKEGEARSSEGHDNSIAVVSLSDEQVTIIGESLVGRNHPIGWMTVDVEE